MKTKFIILTGLAALALAGCESTTPNTNVNLRNANSNQAVVVNSNTNVPVTNANANRRDNANISKEDYEKNRSEYEKDKGSSTIGQGVNDSWLWFKTRAALATTSELRESTINVDVVNDVVTLKGTVASAAEKTKAEQVAKGIDGVKSVKNELKVAPKDSMTNQMVNGTTGGNSKSANTNKK
ncbi:MAG: BON domain-containing protein [Acidobacteria bacterium]|nr:BON domain-containing protein [Acidobacteriota bacterium]